MAPQGLPALYFRTRDNGALVFRVENDTRLNRIELVHIATVHLPRDEMKPHAARSITEQERAEIQSWMANRTAQLAARANDEAWQALEQLHGLAQWAQSKAAADELEALTDPLLLAMHDLRGILVRKKAERLAASRET